MIATSSSPPPGNFELGTAHHTLRMCGLAGRNPRCQAAWRGGGGGEQHETSVPLQVTFPNPRHVPFVTDGSWFPSHCCGGAFAVVCRETLTWVVYPIPIPCHLDHSNAVEVYTSWVQCPVKNTLLTSAHVACATARSLREGGNFTDSKSFITVLHGRCSNEIRTGLVDLLLADCIDRTTPFPPPQHLYSHQEGTFLDLVLDDIDIAAKAQALRRPYPMPVG